MICKTAQFLASKQLASCAEVHRCWPPGEKHRGQTFIPSGSSRGFRVGFQMHQSERLLAMILLPSKAGFLSNVEQADDKAIVFF